MTASAPRGARAWLLIGLGGVLVAVLGAGLMSAAWPTHSGAVGSLRVLMLWLLACGWLAMARGTAMRRLLLLLAGLALLSAAVAWQGLTAGPPSGLPAARAASENALGLGFLLVLGQLMLAGVLPALLCVLAAVLALLAWLVGRQPKQRRVPRSEITKPR